MAEIDRGAACGHNYRQRLISVFNNFMFVTSYNCVKVRLDVRLSEDRAQLVMFKSGSIKACL
jgi:hypothetical protein